MVNKDFTLDKWYFINSASYTKKKSSFHHKFPFFMDQVFSFSLNNGQGFNSKHLSKSIGMDKRSKKKWLTRKKTIKLMISKLESQLEKSFSLVWRLWRLGLIMALKLIFLDFCFNGNSVSIWKELRSTYGTWMKSEPMIGF